MSIKKSKIIGFFIIFLLCFFLHFLYEWIPNPLLSIFLPVNESIWEHMKLLPTSFLLYSIIEYFWLKKNNNFNNYLFQAFIVPLIGIILYLIIYIPIYNMIGDNMAVNIGLLGLIIIIEQFISYKFLLSTNIKHQSIIGIIGIIVMYIVFGYLTYKPIQNYIFYDTKNEKYGIDMYTK